MLALCSGVDNNELEMNIYRNILTPPSSSEESPQSYTMPSPQYYYVSPQSGDDFSTSLMLTTNQQHAINSPGLAMDRSGAVFLTILEEPIDKFRFRYKSEMAGTHGSLTGITSDKTRKQTYPTVRLHNYKGPALIRCTLYQVGGVSDERQPHAHRLIKKNGTEEVDDPHHLPVSEHDGYDACFHSMGIIHTAKKHLVEELRRKKTILKKEEVTRNEGHGRPLNRKEEVEINSAADEESKSINLNIVCLRFDAYSKTATGILEPLCPPVYSHAINNLKSALTGELKIVRMDHSSSPSKGNREIFMLVEKVTKKNIKVRFFETDDDDIEIWSEYGKFSDLDVHHQYAIVFRTPPYKQLDIDHQKTVFIELQRPSDGSRSEPREFTYFPTTTFKPGSKRARSTGYSSSSGSFTYSLGSGDVPVPVLNLPTEFENLLVNSEDLENAVKNVNSDEFEQLFNNIKSHLGGGQSSYHELGLMPIAMDPDMQLLSVDAPGGHLKTTSDSNVRRREYADSYVIMDSHRVMMNRVYTELSALIKINPPKKTVVGMLEYLFQKYVDDEFQNNALHLATIAGDITILQFLLKTISYLKQDHLIKEVNANEETIMHIAVSQNSLPVTALIVKYRPDLSKQDANGNTVLHRAIMASCSKSLLSTVLNCGEALGLNVNAKNNDDHTALHMAVKTSNLSYVELLCKYKADVNDSDKKAGRSVLHVAVTEQAEDIVTFLLHHTDINVEAKDYRGSTALQLAYFMTNVKIYEMIEQSLKSRGLFSECIIKEEEESDEEMECDEVIEYKTERLTPEELTKIYENVKTLTPECLQQVSEILDASGNWVSLADLLDLEHLLQTDWFVKAKSPSQALLKSAVMIGDVLHIRNFLENLEEVTAVALIDKMVMSPPKI